MAQIKSHSEFMTRQRVEELLRSKKDGVLCFTDGSQPYGIPLNYGAYHDGILYLGLGLSGRKYDYFQKCNKVCFITYRLLQSPDDPQRQGWWSIILDGELFRITDPEEIQQAGDYMEAEGLFPPGLKDKFLGAMLKNPEQSNFFKLKISNFGGKQLGEYRPEDEIE
ncbi:pyridoxamine 5'-phosphate oxidase family protein [Thermodesulfobacteriota bacterium]